MATSSTANIAKHFFGVEVLEENEDETAYWPPCSCYRPEGFVRILLSDRGTGSAVAFCSYKKRLLRGA